MAALHIASTSFRISQFSAIDKSISSPRLLELLELLVPAKIAFGIRAMTPSMFARPRCERWSILPLPYPVFNWSNILRHRSLVVADFLCLLSVTGQTFCCAYSMLVKVWSLIDFSGPVESNWNKEQNTVLIVVPLTYSLRAVGLGC